MRALAAACLFAAGCFSTGGGASSGDGGQAFTGPVLTVTVGSLRYGPGVADQASTADVIDQYDGTGQITSSRLIINAVSRAIGATCAFQFERFGRFVQPIVPNTYIVKTPLGTTTDDGTVSPGAGEQVLIPEGSFRCTGSGCDGATLGLRIVGPTEVEGYLAGPFASDAGFGVADVVCSFRVPVRTFQR
jgi:hypothetical protein